MIDEDDLDRLKLDAERYRYIRDNLAQLRSPRMDGQHAWHIRALYQTGETFDEAVDKAIDREY